MSLGKARTLVEDS